MRRGYPSKSRPLGRLAEGSYPTNYPVKGGSRWADPFGADPLGFAGGLGGRLGFHGLLPAFFIAGATTTFLNFVGLLTHNGFE